MLAHIPVHLDACSFPGLLWCSLIPPSIWMLARFPGLSSCSLVASWIWILARFHIYFSVRSWPFRLLARTMSPLFFACSGLPVFFIACLLVHCIACSQQSIPSIAWSHEVSGLFVLLPICSFTRSPYNPPGVSFSIFFFSDVHQLSFNAGYARPLGGSFRIFIVLHAFFSFCFFFFCPSQFRFLVADLSSRVVTDLCYLVLPSDILYQVCIRKNFSNFPTVIWRSLKKRYKFVNSAVNLF